MNDATYHVGQNRTPRKALMIEALRSNQDSVSMGEGAGRGFAKFRAKRSAQQNEPPVGWSVRRQ